MLAKRTAPSVGKVKNQKCCISAVSLYAGLQRVYFLLNGGGPLLSDCLL